MECPFENRPDAGRLLANKLTHYMDRADVIVLALPRGGVPIGWEVARRLHLPLDVLIVRKIGVPHHRELAMGAIASGGGYYLNEDLIRRLGVPAAEIRQTVADESQELRRRERLYRAGRTPLDLHGRVVIVVDDGLATGASMLAAVRAIDAMGAKEVVVALPVIAEASIPDIEPFVDKLVYVLSPLDFYAVGQWYRHFDQMSDSEVRELLDALNPTPRNAGIG